MFLEYTAFFLFMNKYLHLRTGIFIVILELISIELIINEEKILG